MRRVKIVAQMNKSYPFAVLDHHTGAVLLQHQKRDDLTDLCRRLGWVFEEEGARREDPRSSLSTDQL